MNCSDANDVCGPDGARSVPDWKTPSGCVIVLPITW